MAMLYEFPILNQPVQQFSTVINGLKVSFLVRYSVTSRRFSLDLAIDETPVLTGIRMVSNQDLVDVFDLGLGMFFVAGVRDYQAEPTLEAFAEGAVKFYRYG